jgi:tRNA(Ile)-lysidine synthase
MLERFCLYINENKLFTPSHRLLLTVSGGLDSVALAELCHRAEFQFDIAHCNFQLRGDESDRDEAFVHALADKYSVKIHVKRFETKIFAHNKGVSTQMAARQLRYKWFEELRQEYHYDYILTAHHQDDLLETILLNITRGTGLAGLHGILPKNNGLVRPLLFATRNELEHFIHTHQLTWREDSSNATDDYQRNRLRHQVVPILKEMNPKVAMAVTEMSERISANEAILAENMAFAAKEVIQERQGNIWISYEALEKQTSPLERLSFWLAKYNFSYHQVKSIWKQRYEQVGNQYLSPTHLLVTDRKHWVVCLIGVPSSDRWLIESEEGELIFPAGLLKWHTLKTAEALAHPSQANTVYLNSDALSFPLLLRPWQAGDWFCPSGMQGKRKKISDFLIDQKIPRNLKEKVYVIESAEKIVWIVGFRLDERFKQTQSSKNTFALYLHVNN